MNAVGTIADWKRRLTALAEDPPYVFRDTPRELIEQHHRKLTTFVGYSELEIAEAERRLNVRFPTVFRTYLAEMAQSPGDLFCGSDLANIGAFEQFRSDALALMAETDPALSLATNVVVFMSHQGYTFVYLAADGGFDGPPMQWMEGERESRQVAATFADMVDAELALHEKVHRQSHENGGYYVTLHPNGTVSQHHPALVSGDRPLHTLSARFRRWLR